MNGLLIDLTIGSKMRCAGRRVSDLKAKILHHPTNKAPAENKATGTKFYQQSSNHYRTNNPQNTILVY